MNGLYKALKYGNVRFMLQFDVFAKLHALSIADYNIPAYIRFIEGAWDVLVADDAGCVAHTEIILR